MNKVMLMILILCGTIIAEEKPKEETLKIQKLSKDIYGKGKVRDYFHIVKNKEELEKLTKKKIDVDFSKYNVVFIQEYFGCGNYEVTYNIKDNTVKFSAELVSRCTHMTLQLCCNKAVGNFIVPKKYTIKNNFKQNKRSKNE